MTDKSPCRKETDVFRQCLKDNRQGYQKNRCDKVNKSLQECLDNWRKLNNFKLMIDGARVLPPPQCRILSAEIQRCLKQMDGDENKCRRAIDSFDVCMKSASRV